MYRKGNIWHVLILVSRGNINFIFFKDNCLNMTITYSTLIIYEIQEDMFEWPFFILYVSSMLHIILTLWEKKCASYG